MPSLLLAVLLIVFVVLYPLGLVVYGLSGSTSSGGQARLLVFMLYYGGAGVTLALLAWYRINYPSAWAETEPTIYWAFTALCLYGAAASALLSPRLSRGAATQLRRKA